MLKVLTLKQKRIRWMLKCLEKWESKEIYYGKLAWGEAWGNDASEGGSTLNNTEGSEDFVSGNGWAMYSGGHTFTKGSVSQNVAIQRAFFNYSLLSTMSRGATIDYTDPPSASINSGVTETLGANATGTSVDYTFEWVVTPNVGSFSANNIVGTALPAPDAAKYAATTVYTPPLVSVNTDIIISLIVTDGCGNITREDTEITLTPPSPIAPVCTNATFTNPPNADLVTDLKTLITDGNTQVSGFSITTQPTHGTVVLDANAVATYTPNFNNQLQDSYGYTATDDDGLSCTGTVTINTACPTNAATQIFGSVFYDGSGSTQGVIDGNDYGYGTGAMVKLYQDNGVIGTFEAGVDIELTNISPATTNANGGYVFSLDNTPSTTGVTTDVIANVNDDVSQHNDHLHYNELKLKDRDYLGLRFEQVDIPQGATITSAQINFKATKAGSGALTIKAEDIANAPVIPPDGDANETNYLSNIFTNASSSSTTASVLWSTGAIANNDDFNTPDIKDIVQELVDIGTWTNNNAMLFIFNTTSSSDDLKMESDPGTDAPELVINYTIPGTPATGDYLVVLDQSSVMPFVPTPTASPTILHAVNIANVGDSDCFNDFGVAQPNNPPKAFDVTGATRQSCATQTAIAALNVVDPDLSDIIASYTIKTAPSFGALFINSTTELTTFPVTITPTEMATLTFNPENNKGTVTFTFSGTDDGSPAEESNTATYSIVITNCPPETLPLTNETLNSNAPNTSLKLAAPNAADPVQQGTDGDGTIVCFMINTLPTVAQGVLLFDGTPVLAGQNIAIADISKLSFTPSGSFIGNVTFTYAAKDDDGAIDATPATYTIPIQNVAPVAVDVTHPICILADGSNQIIDPLLGTDIDGSIDHYDITDITGLSGGTLSSGTGMITPDAHKTLMFSTSTAGTYIFKYTTTDNLGAESSEATYTINASTAPVANNISTPGIQADAGSTSIPTTTATDDGSIIEYTFQSIPNPLTQGVLYINNPPLTPVLVNDPLTVADLSKLEFDPLSTFVGCIVLNYVAEDDCGFLSAPATYTIDVLPVLTNTTQTFCEDAAGSGKVDNIDLTALAGTIGIPGTLPTGAAVKWFEGSGVSGTDITTSASDVDNVANNDVFTVQYTGKNGGSVTGMVTYTIIALPSAPTSGSDQTVCSDGTTTQTLTATATAPSGSSVVWYTTMSGITTTTTPTQVGVGTTTYYAESRLNAAPNCVSSARTAVVLTINALPSAPTSPQDVTVCATGSEQTLTATATVPSGTTIVWYDAASAGNVVNPATLVSTAAATRTLYGEAVTTATGCKSSSRTAVVLTINALPSAPTSPQDVTVCATGSEQTLTATATVPSGTTIVWYDAASAGNVVNPATLVSTAAATRTLYGEAVTTATGCKSSSRTAVVLTINALPSAPTSPQDVTVCATGSEQTLTATATVPSGTTIVWYDAASAGNVVNPATLVSTAAATRTLYGEAVTTATGCKSSSRTAVVLTINNCTIGIAKTAGTVVNNGNGTYSTDIILNIENFSNVLLHDIQVTDDLITEFGTYDATLANIDMVGEYTVSNLAIVAGATGLKLNSGFNGSADKNLLDVSMGGSLPVNGTFSINFKLTFYPDFSKAPFTNQAIVRGDIPGNDDNITDGDATDMSDDGTNPDPDNDNNPDETDENDPTPISVPVIGIAKSASALIDNNNGTFTTTYTLIVENLGNEILHDVQITDDLTAKFGTYNAAVGDVDMPGEYTVGDPTFTTNSTAALTAESGYTGSGTNTGLLDVGSGGNLAIGEKVTLTFTMTFFPDFTKSPLTNQALASGDSPGNDDGTVDGNTTDMSDNGVEPDGDDDNNPDETDENDPTPLTIPVIGIAKSASALIDNNNDLLP